MSKAALRSSNSRMLRAPGVCRGEEIVDDFGMGSFSAVGREETRLEGFIQFVELGVGVELGGDDAFQLVAAVKELLIWVILVLKAERKDSQRSGEDGRYVSGGGSSLLMV